jgi:Tol biopolymer transport system component
MGEVYRAKDTRLGREVAVKVLPSHLSKDPERRERFEREAKAISSLSHPHICALHDVGREGDADYLVMELLEGDTLQDRLARGALAPEQVMRYGAEIGDALDAAHRRGLVHRDLKPGNIMLTSSGVKVLDFGLARGFPSPGGSGVAGDGLSALPTAGGNLTQEGTILGTFQYMAPEQLEGKPADARTDIFALGAVLYEMATGKKAFSGQSQASLIAAILEKEPSPVSSIQPMTPPALERAIRSCLAKDPEDRWQNSRDLAAELRWIAQAGSQAGAPAVAVLKRRTRERVWMVVAALALVAAGAFVWLALRPRAAQGPVLRFSMTPPANTRIENNVAVSPDGKLITFVAIEPTGVARLWLRPTDSLGARPVEGTEGAGLPFWSPDSRFIAFFANGKLKKAAASGTTPQVLCDAPYAAGGSWGSKGDIVFTPKANDAIYRVSESGGEVTRVTSLDSTRGDISHRWPVFLPDGRRFLVLMIGTKPEANGIYVRSLDGDPPRILSTSQSAPVLAPGYLLFGGPTLMAQAFDDQQATLSGAPAIVADGIGGSPTFTGAYYSVSRTGLLVYRPGTTLSRMTWFDRQGKSLGAVGEAGNWTEPFFSPDGSRLVAAQADRERDTDDLWILQLDRGAWSRLTFDPGDENSALWSPDGKSIAYSSARGLTRISASGAGSPELLHELPKGVFAWLDDWSPDGRSILFERVDPKTKWDLWILDVAERKVRPFLVTPSNESHAAFSPDGRFVAYVSDETGRAEVYAQPADGSGGRWQISNAGGDQPEWPRDGKELFFLAPGGALMAAEVSTVSGFESGPPRQLFTVRLPETGVTGFRSGYLVADRGRKFLVNLPEEQDARFEVVVNWPATLRPR